MRAGRAQVAAFAVGGYIAAAYWFTSSTSFANPAVTIGRTLTDTFAGIRPSSAPMFIVMQILGGLAAIALGHFWNPRLPAVDLVVPHDIDDQTEDCHAPYEDRHPNEQRCHRPPQPAREFEGIFGTETSSSSPPAITKLANATLPTSYLSSERFARQRLKAWPKEGKADDGLPTVLFLCVHNAGRSQMALGWFNHLAGGRAVAWSGGSEPGIAVNPAAVVAMAEIGASPRVSSSPDRGDVRAADVVITMGCGDACPLYPANATKTGDEIPPAKIAAVRPDLAMRSAGARSSRASEWAPRPEAHSYVPRRSANPDVKQSGFGALLDGDGGLAIAVTSSSTRRNASSLASACRHPRRAVQDKCGSHP